MDDILARLRGFPQFKDLPGAILARIAPAARSRTLAPGEFLFREGTPREALYLIAEGQIGVFREHHGHVEPLIVMGAGEALGEGALFSDAPHSSSARAMGRVALTELTREALRTALADDGAAAWEVMGRIGRLMTRRLTYASSREVGLAKAYASGSTRREHDLLGERDVPQRRPLRRSRRCGRSRTSRSPASRCRTSRRWSASLAMVKQAAARANLKLGLLSRRRRRGDRAAPARRSSTATTTATSSSTWSRAARAPRPT